MKNEEQKGQEKNLYKLLSHVVICFLLQFINLGLPFSSKFFKSMLVSTVNCRYE
jgi:hypothetical protein